MHSLLALVFWCVWGEGRLKHVSENQTKNWGFKTIIVSYFRNNWKKENGQWEPWRRTQMSNAQWYARGMQGERMDRRGYEEERGNLDLD